MDRLYVSIEFGGRGLRQLEGAFNSSLFTLGDYIRRNSNNDYVLHAILAQDNKNSTNKSVIKKRLKIGISSAQEFNTEIASKKIVKSHFRNRI